MTNSNHRKRKKKCSFGELCKVKKVEEGGLLMQRHLEEPGFEGCTEASD